jgi:hypothetical protein
MDTRLEWSIYFSVGPTTIYVCTSTRYPSILPYNLISTALLEYSVTIETEGMSTLYLIILRELVMDLILFQRNLKNGLNEIKKEINSK